MIILFLRNKGCQPFYTAFDKSIPCMILTCFSGLLWSLRQEDGQLDFNKNKVLLSLGSPLLPKGRFGKIANPSSLIQKEWRTPLADQKEYYSRHGHRENRAHPGIPWQEHPGGVHVPLEWQCHPGGQAESPRRSGNAAAKTVCLILRAGGMC